MSDSEYHAREDDDGVVVVHDGIGMAEFTRVRVSLTC
jgi:hypothetical protein